MKKVLLLIICLSFVEISFAQNKNWSLHFQQTVIPQHKLAINAPYSGDFSLSDTAETQTSLTTTIYLGRRLWKGAAVFYNPELAGGSGLSQARGIAGFSNGECFRIGNPSPTIYTARLFFRQDFALKGSSNEKEEDTMNSIAGERPVNLFSVIIGKFSIADFFDNNSYAHDPRTQLMNWSLMANGAWDYPANTRGYTWNLVAEYVRENWAIRAASSLVPTYANGPTLNSDWVNNQSNTLEYELSTKIGVKEGKLRLLTFRTTTYMGNYEMTTKMANPDITTTRVNGRTKYGFGLNYEQELSAQSGIFFRGSWNDGQNETWAFTEIDHAISGGYVNKNPFNRKDDVFSLGAALNGISTQHRNYLAKGGYGFIIGDGKLPNYALESILELNYAAKITEWLTISPDYQLIINPAYNSDRGPVHAFALRFHTGF
jgi:high affinity Mn2+ porin